MTKLKRRYKHPCTNCVLVGNRSHFDLYFCKEHPRDLPYPSADLGFVVIRETTYSEGCIRINKESVWFRARLGFNRFQKYYLIALKASCKRGFICKTLVDEMIFNSEKTQ